MRRALFVCVMALAARSGHGGEEGELVLVESGTSRAPIVVPAAAPPFTRRAADELADYILKITGAKPAVIEGSPVPVPPHAVWVGHQPVLGELFPDQDFSFKHHEEILIASNRRHLVIAGRDRWEPTALAVMTPRNTVDGVQREYGTANAVYTFIQNYLNVRWLWPGELGEDIVTRPTLSFAPFQYRYHPELRSRSRLFGFSSLLSQSGYGHSQEWARRQRIQFDSLNVSGGHAFKEWWGRFHEDHPEYFALQPDGTRSGYPDPENAKLCQSNPAVWRQWLTEVERQLGENPNMTVFSAGSNDSYYSGHCVCENCRAWDHPEGGIRPFRWKGVGERRPALSDRHVTFANHCARLLKERFPDKPYWVSMLAYGNSRPPPVAAAPDDNVIITNVANMFWSLETRDKDCAEGKTHAQHYAAWAKLTGRQVWRPNTGNPAGWQNALPDVPIERVMASLRFAVDNGCMGIIVDMIWEHWATQGPLYYALAHMAWNPHQDWHTVMDDYYRRGFGPAATEIRAYWELMEEARNRKVDDYPGETNGYAEVYDRSFFNRAYGLLDAAAATTVDAPEKYGRRIEFVRIGLDHTRLVDELRDLSSRFLHVSGRDPAVAALARSKWDDVMRNADSDPHAVDWGPIRPGERMARGGLFHPDSLKSAKPKQLRAWQRIVATRSVPAGPAPTVELRAADTAGWKLVYHDDFERLDLGDQWQILEGNWSVDGTALCGNGTIVSTRGFGDGEEPRMLRMELEVSTDTEDPTLPGEFAMPSEPVSDLDSLLHVRVTGEEKGPPASGHFFQFGGGWNKANAIFSHGRVLAADESAQVRIEPGKTHRVVVENDGGRLSMFIDGRGVLHALDPSFRVVKDYDRVGFYFYSGGKVLDVKVYVKRPSASAP